MHEGERHYHVHRPAPEERIALGSRPAEIGRGVREILDERKHPRVTTTVRLLDRSRVHVPRHRPKPAVGGDAAELARVRAEVPAVARRALEHPHDEPPLLREGRLVVVGVRVVVPPGRALRRRAQALDRLPKAVQQREKRDLRETDAPDILRRLPVRRLPVEVDVGEKARREPRPEGEQARGEIQRHAIEMDAQKPSQPRVHVRHEGERREKVAAELAVGDPRLPFAVGLEGERVDKDRLLPEELDVVGARVLEDHPLRQGAPGEFQGQESGVAELPEAPLVGVGDRGHDLGTEHGDRPGPLESPFEGDEQARRNEIVVQARTHQRLEIRAVRLGDQTQKRPVLTEDVARRVAERTGDALGDAHFATRWR